ncbi:hypothetical protein MD484_g7392, partial [Candolleomyces efflorescens]
MKSFATLTALVLLAVRSAEAAVYQNADALPANRQFDVIIVGGACQFFCIHTRS